MRCLSRWVAVCCLGSMVALAVFQMACRRGEEYSMSLASCVKKWEMVVICLKLRACNICDGMPSGPGAFLGGMERIRSRNSFGEQVSG